MRFLIPPDNASYTAHFGQEVLRTELDGGAGRYRRDILHSSTEVQVQWIMDREQYDYAMAFYRTIIQRGALPFEIFLVVDGSELGERTCHMVPGTFRLTGQKGLAHYVSALLEVHALIDPSEASNDLGVIEAYNESQGYDPEA